MLKRILKWLLLLPVAYFLIAVLASFIPYTHSTSENTKQHVYISTNGVHADIIIPNEILSKKLKTVLNTSNSAYIAFGWGDKDFYLNTPHWKDLSFKTAFNALFCNSESLMHIERHNSIYTSWVKVPISEVGIRQLITYLEKSFKTNDEKAFILIPNAHYTSTDNFYEANGSYTFFYNCNTWVNYGLKEAKIPTALWTLFDFGIMYHIQD